MKQDIEAVFNEMEEEFCKFARVANPKHPRPDVCAMLMLHELVGGSGDCVTWAGHDEVALWADVDEVAEKATREFLIDLHRCGVRLDEDSFRMFV